MKNKKGFTIIELMVSFVLISIIVVGMLTIALRYRNDAQLSSQKLTVEKYKNTVTSAIQNDIIDLEIEDIQVCTEHAKSCLDFTFKDGSTKKLELSNTNISDRYIRYGGRKFPIEERFTVTPTSLDDTIIRLADEIIFFREEIGEDAIFRLDIPIYHMDIEGDYGIHIVALRKG